MDGMSVNFDADFPAHVIVAALLSAEGAAAAGKVDEDDEDPFLVAPKHVCNHRDLPSKLAGKVSLAVGGGLPALGATLLCKSPLFADRDDIRKMFDDKAVYVFEVRLLQGKATGQTVDAQHRRRADMGGVEGDWTCREWCFQRFARGQRLKSGAKMQTRCCRDARARTASDQPLCSCPSAVCPLDPPFPLLLRVSSCPRARASTPSPSPPRASPSTSRPSGTRARACMRATRWRRGSSRSSGALCSVRQQHRCGPPVSSALRLPNSRLRL